MCPERGIGLPEKFTNPKGFSLGVQGLGFRVLKTLKPQSPLTPSSGPSNQRSQRRFASSSRCYRI